MRADAKGLFWEDVDHKSVKKFEVLGRHGWVEVVPGYWVEEKILNNPELDYLDYIYPLHRAYEEVRGKSAEKRVPPEPVWLNDDYLPNLLEARNYKYNIFTDEELINASMQYMLTGQRYELEYDIECYYNYFLIAFYCRKTGKVIYFEKTDETELEAGKLRWVLENFKVVGFNSNNYDIFIASMAINGCSTLTMKLATNQIIAEGARGYNILRSYKTKKINCDHIDLIEVAPLFASLKIYGGRMHSKRMQDLPFHESKKLNADQITITRWYCINDLTTTSELKETLKKELALREQMSLEYGIDLRSKSDAQIAEAVITHELEAATGSKYYPPTILPGTVYYYHKPSYMSFKTPLMNSVLDLVLSSQFVVSEYGNIGLPPALADLKINIANSTYKLGIGGLHSTEKSVAHHSGKRYILVDRDVTSYYPFIILNQGLYPQHIGPRFLDIYRQIVMRRLAAKESGDKSTANSLKIVINGSFGKFGSMYSALYAPDLLIQTTISGQLSLLMLIEELELNDIEVVSANTDGLVIKCDREKEALMDQIVVNWEKVTQFQTEATPYESLGSQNVNNYIGVKAKGSYKEGEERVKVKGVFAKPGLSKNPTNEICIDAIEALLCDGIPIEKTIRECKDIRLFVNVRTVKGGAVKVWGQSGSEIEYLGKAIRWYYSTKVTGEIVYATSGNKVPKSDGARPCLLLPDTFPDDVDYDWYIAEAEKMLRLAGF